MSSSGRSFWTRAEGDALAQGDLIPRCRIFSFAADLAPAEPAGEMEVALAEADLIVVTQSCDLVNDKAQLVALCPIHGLSAFETSNPAFKTKNRWEMVRKGQQPGLHMLASPESPDDNRSALVVDFGQIHSLPQSYLARRTSEAGPRWRLESPFLEHFSQAFARYFMRVGLPSVIAPFK